ncbi:G-alpha-domain-containing protein [Pluteus cervinus]|uniref:G-alpha-domain-containing protein n=1 Tax=Pluteus cervinus TaxID=181527 RepID=A0ACD3AJG6_9AGAR|nr:G-alpha-domain-containing protein [Pluteus cervinus]
MAAVSTRRLDGHVPSSSISTPLICDYKQRNSHLLFYDEQAEKISNLIDEEIKRESNRQREARRKEVKVMLLGQAESGKSTLQKQFQLYYASHSLDSERPSWRPVVYFNIIKAIRMILDELDYQFNAASKPRDKDDRRPSTTTSSGSLYRSPETQSQIAAIRTRLLPLIAMESALATELSGGVSVGGGKTGAFVRTGWQALVGPGSARGQGNGRPMRNSETTNLVARTMSSLGGEVEKLWKHQAVRTLVHSRKLRLDDSAGFFLDSIKRIAEPEYMPSTDDILSVRLQTLGVMEHQFVISLGGSTYNWKLYDVGGARGQRHAWMPYFDDATAIIFLAPISAFDQYLEEDARTNRIDDSLQLFTAICSNKLLSKAHLVLLLNKADLLKKKLKAGAKVRKYITSFGDRPNTYESVSEYFRSHFVQVHRRKDTFGRALYVHFTSMLDIKATQSIISDVGEAIIRQHIASVGLA